MTSPELRARLEAIGAERRSGDVADDAVLAILDVSTIPAAVLVPIILGPGRPSC